MTKNFSEIRQEFLNFFHIKGHEIVSGSSLIPNNDPKLLFTNAGMNQFKDVFLGFNQRNYSRATTSQRCIRAGGKHNDLENVGYTARHHTFFEMLGNFSFGDYFKKDAIKYAWELLNSKKWFNIPKERLWVTVYETDDETYEIWEKEICIPNERIIRIGNKKGNPYYSDNFWYMGEDGPCGPCTEIFYDHGDHIPGNPPGSSEENGERYIEIWNIVFIQFHRQSDGTMKPLKKPSVDTGMGLERIAAVLQHVNSNYEIDLFRTLIKAASKVTGFSDINNNSLKVIADHIRSCAFLISDGVIPSNEHRGYVLRRIIRRAIRHGRILGANNTFFYKLVDPLIDVMDSAGNELKYQKEEIKKVLKREEEQFSSVLNRGIILLNEEIAKIENDTLDGKIAFRLHDTYGFPVDITMEICREQNIKVDEKAFKIEKEKHCQQARNSNGFNFDLRSMKYIKKPTEFQGYDCLELDSNVIGICVNGKIVDDFIDLKQEAIVFLDKTPFYAESGGQVGDQGELKNLNLIFKVHDTKKYGEVIGHFGKLIFGSLKIFQKVQAIVDKNRRSKICLNHSATHLMHSALQEIIGDHVVQKGSLVNEKMLRFDFPHFEKIKPEAICFVENLVNLQIRRNIPITINSMDLEDAKSKNIIPLFGKQYTEQVRVVNIGDFSAELCCGTHALRTGDIGLFLIVSESITAAGIHRIKAITGETAISFLHDQRKQLQNVTNLLKVNSNYLTDKVRKTLERIHFLENELLNFKKEIANQENKKLLEKSSEIQGTKLVVSELVNIEPKVLLYMIDELKSRFSSIVIVLASLYKEKIYIIIGVSKSMTNCVQAEKLLNIIVEKIDGKGGGNLEIAQAVGKKISALSSTLDIVKTWIRKCLHNKN